MKKKKVTSPDGTSVECVELPCCACNGRVSFATPETTKNPTLFHTIPYCERFETTDTAMQVVEYMRECREKSELN